MGKFLHDWPALLPRINKLRSKGLNKHDIAQDLGISVSTYDTTLRRMRNEGLMIVAVLQHGRSGTYQKSALTLEKIIPLIPQGLSYSEMAELIGSTKSAVCYTARKRFSPEQRAAWESACYARRRGSFASSRPQEPKSPYKRKQTCIETAQAVSEQFEPARCNFGACSHPAMPVGGIAWAAIWGGNPPPYPHDMMRGGLC